MSAPPCWSARRAGRQACSWRRCPCAARAIAVGPWTVTNASRRFVLDYLTDEVLEPGSRADVQRFLLRTAILERLSGLTGRRYVTGPRERRLHVAAAPSAYQPLSRGPRRGRRSRYRYHALFADLLRIRARCQPRRRAGHVAPSRDVLVHSEQAAADRETKLWSLDQALRHALAAGDVAQAVDLVARASAWLLGENEQVTLVRWLGELPRPVVGARADLASSPRRVGARAHWSAHAAGRLEWPTPNARLPRRRSAVNSPRTVMRTCAATSRRCAPGRRTTVAISRRPSPGTAGLSRAVSTSAVRQGGWRRICTWGWCWPRPAASTKLAGAVPPDCRAWPGWLQIGLRGGCRPGPPGRVAT